MANYLIQTEGYPAMICSNKDKVYGEVYEVNDAVLQKLDELEEYTGNAESDLYDRITETIYFGDREIRAFVYVAQDKEMLKKVIISGDWVEYQKDNKSSRRADSGIFRYLLFVLLLPKFLLF